MVSESSHAVSATAQGDASISQMRFSAVAIVVSDMDESIAWYQKVLGLSLVSEGSFETSYQNRPVKVRLGFLEGVGYVDRVDNFMPYRPSAAT